MRRFFFGLLALLAVDSPYALGQAQRKIVVNACPLQTNILNVSCTLYSGLLTAGQDANAPNSATYVFDAVPGRYKLYVVYDSPSFDRAVRLEVNGWVAEDVLHKIGGAKFKHQICESAAEEVPGGPIVLNNRNTLKISRSSSLPHVCRFEFLPM